MCAPQTFVTGCACGLSWLGLSDELSQDDALQLLRVCACKYLDSSCLYYVIFDNDCDCVSFSSCVQACARARASEPRKFISLNFQGCTCRNSRRAAFSGLACGNLPFSSVHQMRALLTRVACVEQTGAHTFFGKTAAMLQSGGNESGSLQV